MFSHASGSVGRDDRVHTGGGAGLEPDANPRCFAWSAHCQAELINELWRTLMCASLSELISCRITRIRWPRFERGFFGVTEVGKIALHPSARWRSLSAGFPRSSSPASADSLLSKGISASSGSFTCGAETQASLSWRVTKSPQANAPPTRSRGATRAPRNRSMPGCGPSGAHTVRAFPGDA